MRDGVELVADHYEPATSNPAGTVLLRGPYGRGLPSASLFCARVRVARLSRRLPERPRDVRLRRGVRSDGARNRRRRRHRRVAVRSAVVHRVVRHRRHLLSRLHPVGTADRSAAGDEGRRHHRRAARRAGPRWGTGTFGLNDFLGWSDMVAHQEDPRGLRAVVRQVRARRTLARATARCRSARRAARCSALARRGTSSGWTTRSHDDPFWAPLQLHEALERTQIPVLLLGGWQDLFLEQTLAQYDRLKRRGVPVAVTIGPWTHTQMMTKGAPTVHPRIAGLVGHSPRRATRTWRASRCASTSTGTAGSTCRTGRPRCPSGCCICGPRAGSATRPDRTRPRRRSPTTPPTRHRPSAAGCWRRRVATATTPGWPNDPTCSTFTGDPLQADLYAVGTPVIQLSHSCDNRYNDLFVRISEVDAKGRSRNVSDGYRAYRNRFRRWSGSNWMRSRTAFRAGSRIRVLIAGGSHPRFARNLGTGEPMISGRRLAAATHTVHLGEGGRRGCCCPRPRACPNRPMRGRARRCRPASRRRAPAAPTPDRPAAEPNSCIRA